MEECSIDNVLAVDPAFKWCAKRNLQQRDCMIGPLKAQRIQNGRMKFRFEIPVTVEDTVSLDKNNGNSLWQDSINNEIKNSCIAFKLLELHGDPHVGYTDISCHLVFDLKLDMKRKYKYMAGDHLTDVSTHMTYLSVMYHDTVRIGFIMTSLNGLDIIVGYIKNTILEAPNLEKILFYAGN